MKQKVLLGIATVFLVGFVTQLLYASNGSTKDATAVPEGQAIQSEDIGEYKASGTAPDILTTSGSNIVVTDGSGMPDNPFDYGVIQLTGKSGAVATFSGRTTGWGCIYDVAGVYTGNGTGDDRWHSQFKAEVEPRILLEVNGEGDGDDFIQMVANGAKLNVEARDVPANVTSILVTLSNTPNPGTVSMSSTVTLSSATGFKNSVSLQGTAAGDISFSVSGCTPTPSGTSFNTSDTAEATVVQVALKSVTFLNNSTNLFAVKKDDGSAYSTPHWQTSNDQQSPICYKRNTKMKVTVKFAAPGLNNTSVTIKGSGGGFTFGGANGVSGIVSNGVLEITNLESDQNLPNTIAIYQPLIIDWQFKIGTASFLSSGKSENLAYIILEQPNSSILYHTVLNLSCKNANGKSAIDSSTVNAIYSEFTDRRVYNIKGQLLKYWGSASGIEYDTQGLITTCNGTCQAWSDLMYDLIKCQSSSASIFQLIFMPKYDANAGESLDYNEMNFFVKNGTYISSTTKPTLDGSAPGQGGIPCSQQWTTGHALNLYGTTYYDPSYGFTTSASIVSWQQSHMIGTGKKVNGIQTYLNANANPVVQIITATILK